MAGSVGESDSGIHQCIGIWDPVLSEDTRSGLWVGAQGDGGGWMLGCEALCSCGKGLRIPERDQDGMLRLWPSRIPRGRVGQ